MEANKEIGAKEVLIVGGYGDTDYGDWTREKVTI